MDFHRDNRAIVLPADDKPCSRGINVELTRNFHRRGRILDKTQPAVGLNFKNREAVVLAVRDVEPAARRVQGHARVCRAFNVAPLGKCGYGLQQP